MTSPHLIEPRDVPWALARIVRRSALLVPPLGAHHELTRLRGWIYDRFWPVPPARRSNLQSTLGAGPETERVVRQAHRFSQSRRLMYLLPRLRGFHDPGRWPIAGSERLTSALESGHGVILIGAHFGYGEVVGPILRVHGFPVTQVAARWYLEKAMADRTPWTAEGSRFRHWVQGLTRHAGDILLPGDLAAELDVRPIFRALERNQAVLMAGDAQLSVGLVQLPFLGRSLLFATGWAKIAARRGCPVLPVFGVPGNRRHPVLLEIQEPLRIDPQASVAENVLGYVRILEGRIRDAPHLWSGWARPGLFESGSAGMMPDEHFADPYSPR